MRGARWADEQSSYEDMRQRVPGNMIDCFELIESTMFKGPWVLGKSYTVADPYLFTLSSWLASDSVDIARFPRVADHAQRMAERESVKRANAMESAA